MVVKSSNNKNNKKMVKNNTDNINNEKNTTKEKENSKKINVNNKNDSNTSKNNILEKEIKNKEDKLKKEQDIKENNILSNSSIDKKDIENKEYNNEDIIVLNENEYDELINVINKNKSNKKKYYILIGIIFIGLFLYYLCVPKINLLGEEETIITYYDKYIDSGYNANILWKDITNKVKIDSNLVDGKLGKYKIEYSVNYGFLKVKKERYVTVIDDIDPVININNDIIKICPNQELPKLEYSVIDEYDGDITSNTLEEIKDNIIKISAIDSSNNIAVKEISIDRVDNVNPEIYLKGYSTIYLVAGESYLESGYTASDNCDGDLSSKVKISGSVGTDVGNYKLTYSVSDSSGNKSQVVREIIVINKYITNNGYASNGSIYLTFDDGPNEGTTNVILDVLKDEGIKATFFVTSNGPDYLIKRMHDEGHTVALHTSTHNYGYIYSSIDNYFNDLNTISARVERITGQKSMIIRFPGGSSNTVSRNYKTGIMTSLSQLVLSKGYRYYDWNIDSMDASTAYSSQAVYNNVVSHLSKNKVNMVLMHDTKVTTRDALRNIIRYGKSQGYNFEKIDMSTYMVKHGINN